MEPRIFHGTEREATELMRAMANNCQGSDDACRFAQNGQPAHVCSAHAALLDQRFLDGILWARRAVESLRAEEGI